MSTPTAYECHCDYILDYIRQMEARGFEFKYPHDGFYAKSFLVQFHNEFGGQLLHLKKYNELTNSKLHRAMKRMVKDGLLRVITYPPSEQKYYETVEE